MRVAFLHPDLGLGGAEKLVVDAALGLQAQGHEVVIYTSHHDPARCFPETANGTLDVEVFGSWCPSSIFGRFTLICAIIKQIYLVLRLFGQPYIDVAVVDQLSAGVPLLRVLNNVPVIFYCHFPDMLLNPARDERHEDTTLLANLRKLYRWPLDTFEEITTGHSDRILVNSAYTADVFRSTFKNLSERKPHTVHPSIEADSYKRAYAPSPVSDFLDNHQSFISINRYEGKKNIGQAIRAFAAARDAHADVRETHLIIAGGWDQRLQDNVKTYKHLTRMCATLDLTFGDALPSTAQVIFLRNISDDEKLALLRSSNSLALLYTPPNEHFGIVPLEAMACSLPVLACNHGGPKESIEHEVSGFLLPSEDVSAWVEAMAAVTRPGAKDKMGSAGAEQVVQRFSRKSMATTLDREVREVFSMARPWAEKETQDGLLRMAFALFMIFMLTLVFSIDAFTENKLAGKLRKRLR